MPKKGAVYRTAFSKYGQVKKLGEGGCGMVYLVEDGSGQQHALKLLDRTKNNSRAPQAVQERTLLLPQQPTPQYPSVDRLWGVHAA